MKNKIKKYININFKCIVTICIVTVIGILLGLVGFSIIDVEDKTIIVQEIKKNLSILNINNFSGLNIIFDLFLKHMQFVFLLFISMFVIIAPFIVCVIYFMKGFLIGLYISTLFCIFGVKLGIISTLLIVIIPNIIFLPMLIFLGVEVIKFHYLIYESKEQIFKVILKLLSKVIICVPFIILSVILEQFMINYILQLYLKSFVN